MSGCFTENGQMTQLDGSNSFSIHNAQKITDYCFCSGSNQSNRTAAEATENISFSFGEDHKTFNFDLKP